MTTTRTDILARLRNRGSYDRELDHAAADEIARLRVLLHQCLCTMDADYHTPLIKEIADAGVSHTCGEATS